MDHSVFIFYFGFCFSLLFAIPLTLSSCAAGFVLRFPIVRLSHENVDQLITVILTTSVTPSVFMLLCVGLNRSSEIFFINSSGNQPLLNHEFRQRISLRESMLRLTVGKHQKIFTDWITCSQR